jgi:hypothetical protein
MRLPLVDSMHVARRSPLIHALIEVDVTDPRRAIYAHKVATGEPLSFTAYVIVCLARAIAEHPCVQAYRLGRRRLVPFHDVGDEKWSAAATPRVSAWSSRSP